MKKIILSFVAAVSVLASFGQSTKVEPVISDPASVVKEFLDGVRYKEHNKVVAMLHPEVMWIQPGSNRLSGFKKSREEVLNMGKTMGEITEKTIQLAEIKFLSATGNSVACLLYWKGKLHDGTDLSVENIDVYTVENGKIISARVYSSDIEQENAFWGK